METTTIEKSEWKEYFETFSKDHVARTATCEIISPSLGDQKQVSDKLFHGISYDPNDDIVQVLVEGLDHIISSPISISVAKEGVEQQAIEVRDGEDIRHLITITAAKKLS